MKNKIDEDEFLLLSEDKAIEVHFQTGNFKLYKWLISIMFFISILILPITSPKLNIIEVSGLVFTIIILGIMWFIRNKKVTEENFYIFFKVSLLLAFFIIISEDFNIWEHPSLFRLIMSYILPFILLFIRLRPNDSIFIYSFILGINLFDNLVPIHDKSLLRISILIVAYIIFLGISLSLSEKKKGKFLKRWRKEIKLNQERLRMKQELKRAKEIQLDMLPKTLPKSEKWEIAWKSLPATEVGGDYYDLFTLNKNEIALVVGDVSGHGLASGLVLSGTKAGLHILHDEINSPENILSRLNKMMKKTTDKKTFMTMVYTVFNFKNNVMTLSNAGHLPVIHYCSKKKEFFEIRQHSLPLGARINTRYNELKIKFKSNDIFIFYSDGLTETRNINNQQYDEIRFWEYIKDLILKNKKTQEILDLIFDDVKEFRQKREQEDDITFVVVKIK